MQKEWSQGQKEMTREVLYEMDIAAFTVQLGNRPNKGCMMVHLDGREGNIRLSDASSEKYPIFDYETDELLEDCQTIAQVLASGWKLGT